MSLEDLKKRGYDLDIKNPNRKEEVLEYTSEELIKKLADSFVESQKLLEEIKKEL
jgi:type I restriction enzyme M protein